MEMSITKANIRRNFSLYRMYLFSTTIILSVFVAFLNFTSDKLILEKISENGRVEMMVNGILVFLIVFLIFFLSYFNHFFIKKRSREIGILALLGFSKSKLIKIVCLESLIILSISYIFSLLGGTGLYIIISQSIIYILGLSIKTVSFLSITSLIKSGLLVVLIFLINSTINIIIISKQSLIEFVNYSKKVEKRFETRVSIGGLALLLLVCAYILCLLSMNGTHSIWFKVGVSPMFLIVGILIFLGTFLTIRYGLIFLLHLKKKDRNKLYTPVGNIIYPKFIFRISTKNKLLVILSFLLTLTVAIIGMMTITLVYPIKAVDRLTPSVIEYVENSNNKEIKKISDTITDKYGADKLRVSFLRLSTSPPIPIVENGSKTLDYFDVVRYSDYKQLSMNQNKNIKVKKDQLSQGSALLVNYYPMDKAIGMNFLLENEFPIKVQDVTTENIFSFAASVTTLVVNDKDFESLNERFKSKTNSVVTLNGKELRDNKGFYEEFASFGAEIQSSYLKKYVIIRDNASTFIFIMFIAILLVVCTASILYFTNLLELMENEIDYLYLKKIGYNSGQVTKIINKEIGILFSIPIIIGLMNGSFILFAFRFIFIDNLIGSKDLIYGTVMSFMLFIMCYYIFFFATKRTARRSLKL